jgi:tyrosyl-DNA phosphodiesterase-1
MRAICCHGADYVQEQAERYPNVGLISAYTPDQFGTHHSKMLVLLRHDDTAQIVIHTAVSGLLQHACVTSADDLPLPFQNMIHRDWSNMTQAVWQSPLLPLLPSILMSSPDTSIHPIGSGERFKVDFMRYLKAYGHRLSTLTALLRDYDFSSIRAAFLGSVPSRQKPAAAKAQTETSFGWLGMQEILSTVPSEARSEASSPPHIVIQISSIATLGAQPTWLKCLQTALARSTVASTASSGNTNIFNKGKSASIPPKKKELKPTYNIIFPTPEEIRTSLDGYGSGASIHIKLQSQQQIKQQEYLHPLFCHWRPTSTPDATPDATPYSPAKNTEKRGEALRGPAAPHIKTYIRFSDQEHKTIDWAMVTSANLSKQAWGDVVNKKDEIWIQSWEAGVVVWPALFAEPDAEKEVVMVPVFAKDMPGSDDESSENKDRTVVGFRMPYDLPLQSYASMDKPWCATAQYLEPDWKGQAWVGYGNH